MSPISDRDWTPACCWAMLSGVRVEGFLIGMLDGTFGRERDLSLVTKPIVEERIKVAINPEYPEQTVMIGSTLTKEGRNRTNISEHSVLSNAVCGMGCSSGFGQKIAKGQAADRVQALDTGGSWEALWKLGSIIKEVLSRPEVAGRLQKWSIKLGEYTIHYRPRVSVKGQILVDFIVERPEEDSPDTLMAEEEELLEPWILFMDGSSCTDGFGAGLILINPEGIEFTYALKFRFDATNNEAE
ncbi:hypothetical protein Tco_0874037 [Tanacetum coccineum]|uniref:Reverse transcriptase domain-containing protein n=1 Tax=Tanacetum coccineum TaxID=301880 RepID=A0ABQ5BNM4_9ASTR